MLKSYKPLVDNLPLSMNARLQERNASMNNGGANGSRSAPDSPANLRETRTADSHAGREKDESTFPPMRASMEEHQGLNDKSQQRDHTASSSRNGTLPGEEHLDKHAFDHPATYEDYPTIWIPQDRRGYYEREVADTKAAGVDVSTEGATMNDKGKVEISRSPPDEDWDESQ